MPPQERGATLRINNFYFRQEWQPYPVDPYSAISHNDTSILLTSVSDVRDCTVI